MEDAGITMRRAGGANNSSSPRKKTADTKLMMMQEQDDPPQLPDDINADVIVSSSQHGIGENVMAGLTVAGLAASLLTTTFGLFHVDTFLSAYQLPVSVYSVGNFVFAIINTVNDVAGAWLVDQVAASSAARRRQDLVGLTGCIFALAFLTPFFRPSWHSHHWFWDGLHFVVSLSLYDSMYSFAMILYGSIVTEDHEMSQAKRVRFLAMCKVVNLIANFGIARVGLAIYDVHSLGKFRIFLLVLALVVCALSVVAQSLILGKYNNNNNCTPTTILFPNHKVAHSPPEATPRKKLKWRRVVQDFVQHKNFRAWIGMEMLLESQNTFNMFFRKTFVDRLLIANGGVDKGTCDWMLSAMRPITAIVSLAVFVPIRKFGYPKVYRWMFGTNLALSLVILCVADCDSTNWIMAFLFFYPVLTASVQSAGFALAMADMVMDMKHMHVTDGRYDEPSLSGMFMGVNALFCKPMEGILPVLAAQAMRNEERAKQNLFYVLSVPPLVYSCLQLLSWRNYDLEPNRAEQKRKELKKLLSTHSDGV